MIGKDARRQALRIKAEQPEEAYMDHDGDIRARSSSYGVRGERSRNKERE